MAELVTWLFSSRVSQLKLLQLLCGIITILFIIDGKLQWSVYTFIFVAVIIISIITFITLVMYFLRLQTQKTLPWVSIEIMLNAIAAILCFSFAAILIYDYAKMAGGEFRHHKQLPPRSLGEDGWRFVLVFNRVDGKKTKLPFA